MLDDDAKLTTLRDFIRWGASRFNEAGLFFGHGTDNALDEALALVLHALHLSHDLPEPYLQSALTADERMEIIELLSRRIDERIPAAYLTRKAWFCGMEFYVNEHVLVPRSPIAELIESGFAPWVDPDGVEAVLDLCTQAPDEACADRLGEIQDLVPPRRSQAQVWRCCPPRARAARARW